MLSLLLVWEHRRSGGALFASFVETIFTNRLASGLRKFAPNVDGQRVITAGTLNVRTDFFLERCFRVSC
jgi:hypothetical protein